MRLSRLRSGELLALGAAILLAVVLGLDWFLLSTPDARLGAHESGIRSLGWLAALVLVTAIGLGLTLAWTTLTNRPAGLSVTLAVLTTVFGVFATIAILVRLVLQPGLGVEAGNADVDLQLPAWLGLALAVLLTAGAWRTMADERTDARESRAQTERVLAAGGEVRPAPPPTMQEQS